ncbi:X-Pro dipeptidyl-peptidase protein [Aspergillus ellipticus CBS 707.79]|uniref:X-Pro dipeptidyl-peptidase protein n=1 Tax=Aspergillus ellipticus CBS 707.79 TaxID=1448320 RepID=A0A319DU09_9EURO|nr:X-Pro dipeptidyl-peptidase protein [Aspergillus ellipticus CBS 707.79]
MTANQFLETDHDHHPYTFIKNIDIPLKSLHDAIVRANVYLPKDAPLGSQTYPVIATYGPYGKDVPYAIFNKKSWDQINPAMKSIHSSWETPDPVFWTQQGYAVVRVDEVGLGQSPGKLDVLSPTTSLAFFDVVEWCAEQEWSTGKVGLLGVSYYAATQWSVAARKPKGLAAIIPWEGFSDFYRESSRHGGILADQFIAIWWHHSIQGNQYGIAGRGARSWGDDTLEGDVDPETLIRNRADLLKDSVAFRFGDDEYCRSREFDLSNIEVPLMSVANWGGILLHLRGNVIGFMRASSRYKFLRFVVGRHDLPFYWQEAVQLQLSFLDCFLKDRDHGGWKTTQPRVNLCLRDQKCNPDNEMDQSTRPEMDWPIPDTQYTKFFLTPQHTLSTIPVAAVDTCTYDTLGGNPVSFRFTAPSRLEVTGHIVAHLTVSASRANRNDPPPSDIDIFVTLRKLDASGNEAFYTGTIGDPVPIVKGWLRVSLRAVDESHPQHREYLPYRHYRSTDVQPVNEDEKYPVDVEVWPTNTVLQAGETLVLEIAGHDTQGVGSFGHQHAQDRDPKVFAGLNHVEVGKEASWLLLPVIPPRGDVSQY